MNKQTRNIFLTIAGIIGLLLMMKKKKISYGVMFSGWEHEGDYLRDDEKDIQGLKELNVKMVRSILRWSRIEKEKGIYDFTLYDKKDDKLNMAGVEPVYILCYSNILYNSWEECPEELKEWYNEKAEKDYSDVYVPMDEEEFQIFKEAFGNYVYETVKHYKGKVKYFEIWNEPNGTRYWRPTSYSPRETCPDCGGLNNWDNQINQYIELLKIGYTKAKEANPNAIILAAGMSPEVLLNKKTETGTGYIEEFYNQGAKDYFDILSIHPYGIVNDDNNYTEKKISELKRIMDENGDFDKKIWVTEFGYNSKICVEEIEDKCVRWETSEEELKKQVFWLENSIKTFKKYPYITTFFWHTYGDWIKDGMGLIRWDELEPDYNKLKKPAFYKYKDIIKK